MAEANMKVEGLETEVAALKTLVLTSTPSQPNKHLHPQVLRITQVAPSRPEIVAAIVARWLKPNFFLDCMRLALRCRILIPSFP